jgi:hypothetical protein
VRSVGNEHAFLALVDRHGGETIESLDCVVAARGRLVRPIDAWTSGGAARFAREAHAHARRLVAEHPDADQPHLQRLLADAASHLPRGSIALSAYCSAMTVAWLQGGDRFDDAGYRQERAWQSAFIAEEVAS